MNYKEYMANIKAYRNGTLMQAAPTDALSDWHEKYFDTAVSALSKKMIADHVEHSEDADKFGKDFVSLVAILEEDGVSKKDIGKELAAVSKAAQSQADAAIKKLDSVQHSTDTFEGYQAAIKAYKEAHLEHGEWKKHKYIRIENGRYIYPEDVKKGSDNKISPIDRANKALTSKLSNNPANKSASETKTPTGGNQVSGKQAVKNKVSETLNAFKTVGKKAADLVKEGVNEKKTGSTVEEYVMLADGSRVPAKEYWDNFRKNIAETDSKYKEQQQKKAENEARKAAREATEKEKQAQEKEREFKETAAKIEQEQAEKKEKETAEKKSEAPKQEEVDRSKPIKPDKMTEEQREAFKEMSKRYMDDMYAAVDTIQKREGKQAKVVVTASDPYTGAPVSARVDIVLGEGLTQPTNYYFKNIMEDATPDNLQRIIDQKKKVQHSDTRAAFYAAVDEYKSKKGLNQRVPL